MTDVEKIRALKSLIKEHLKGAGVAEKIEAALGDNKDALSRENVIDHVVRDIKNTSLSSPEKVDEKKKVHTGKIQELVFRDYPAIGYH